MLADGMVEAALQHAFLEAENDLELHARREKIQLFLSGSTASCALWHPKKHGLWIGHVGDSTVALIDPVQGNVLQKTQDHKPSVPIERARCMLQGCSIDSTEHADGTTEMRIFVKDKTYPGITMTRSLGDICVKDHGICASPEVINWTVPETFEGKTLEGRQPPLLIMASDGLWEFFSTEEVSIMVRDFLAMGLTFPAIADKLVRRSRTKWRENEGSYCDDITVLLVPLTGSVLQPLAETSSFQVCTGRVNQDCTVT
jgi:serine/threonine protein phosphatase PrpC